MNVRSIHETVCRQYRDGSLIFYLPWSGCYNGESREMQELARRKRRYTLSRIKIRSACAAAWGAKQSKFMLFLTFTLPVKMTEREAAKVWDLTLNTLRNTYNIKSYVWIKEYQQNGKIHYHIVVDRNRINICNLQASYNAALVHVVPGCVKFNNSCRLGKRPIIRNPIGVSRYISKYITKNREYFESRAYGYSENLVLYRNLDTTDAEKLIMDKDECILLVDDAFFCIYRLINFFDTSYYPVPIYVS